MGLSSVFVAASFLLFLSFFVAFFFPAIGFLLPSSAGKTACGVRLVLCKSAAKVKGQRSDAISRLKCVSGARGKKRRADAPRLEALSNSVCVENLNAPDGAAAQDRHCVKIRCECLVNALAGRLDFAPRAAFIDDVGAQGGPFFSCLSAYPLAH
jgi:hypothetical protein